MSLTDQHIRTQSGATNLNIKSYGTDGSGLINIGRGGAQTGQITIGDSTGGRTIYIDGGTNPTFLIGGNTQIRSKSGFTDIQSSLGLTRFGINGSEPGSATFYSVTTNRRIEIQSLSSDLRIHGYNGVLSIRNDGNNTTHFMGSGTGLVTLANLQTSGNLEIGFNSLRVGTINIGHPDVASGVSDITIDAGASAVNIRGALGLRADDGISFDAGTTTLSSYLEGTFTPVVTPGTSGSFTHNKQVGYWTRIGQRVFFELYVEWNASVSPSGTITIATGTLPSTQNVTDYQVACTLGDMDGISGGGTDSQLAAYIAANTNVIQLSFEDLQTAATGSTALDASNLDTSDGFFTISGSFITA